MIAQKEERNNQILPVLGGGVVMILQILTFVFLDFWDNITNSLLDRKGSVNFFPFNLVLLCTLQLCSIGFC